MNDDLKLFNLWLFIAFCIPEEHRLLFWLAVGSVVIYGVSTLINVAIAIDKKLSP